MFAARLPSPSLSGEQVSGGKRFSVFSAGGFIVFFCIIFCLAFICMFSFRVCRCENLTHGQRLFSKLREAFQPG